MNALIAVASRHGSTREIGEAVGHVLRDGGIGVATVDLADPAGQPQTLVGFDGVILGSGVYMGRWQKPAREFAARHAAELAGLPVWLFSSGPLGDPPRPDTESAVDISEMTTEFTPRDHRVFSGRLQRKGLGFREQAVARAVKAPEGDFRDWGEVSSWSESIARSLLNHAR